MRIAVKLFTAIVKTVCEKINQSTYNYQMRTAQKEAYDYACKKAKGNYDPKWQSNYRSQLKRNQQKTKDKRELRSTFISNL